MERGERSPERVDPEAQLGILPQSEGDRFALLLRAIGLDSSAGPLRRAVFDQRISVLIYAGALAIASSWAIFGSEPNGYGQRILSRLLIVALVALAGLGWALESRRLDQSAQAMRQGVLQQLALSDDLTGLANRRSFFQSLQQEWVRYQRHRRPFALIILDLDGFKQVNDRFGHQTGDRALQWLAGHLRRSLRQGDLAARLGGDEFALLLPETSANAAQAVLDRLCAEVKEDRSLLDIRTGAVVRVRISGGIGTPSAATPDADHVMLAADTHLYARKAALSADHPTPDPDLGP